MSEVFFANQQGEGLTRTVQRTAAPDVCFETDLLHTVKKTLTEAVNKGNGIAVVTGAAGTGKTLLLRILRQELEWNYTVPPIINGIIETPKALYQQLLYNLNVPFAGTETAELRMQLLDYAQHQITPGIVLLFDESQYLAPQVLEDIRVLRTVVFESGSQRGMPLFRVVFAGTFGFEEKLTLPVLTAFNQNITVRCGLETFTLAETQQYTAWLLRSLFEDRDETSVAEVLRRAGAEEAHRIDPLHRGQPIVFSEQAQRQIYNLTGGVPRLVAQVCSAALEAEEKTGIFNIDAVWSQIQGLPADGGVTVRIEEQPANTVLLPEEVKKIIEEKKNVLQLRSFDNAVEFGALEDDDTGTAAQGPPNIAVYKPAYPDAEDEEVSGERNKTERTTLNTMDTETLKQYGEQVLKDRPTFIRREPKYAYTEISAGNQTDDPDGAVICLNWQQKDGQTGTAYSEYLTKADFSFAANTIDEAFDETEQVGKQPVPLAALYKNSGLKVESVQHNPLSSTFGSTIAAMVKKITAAAEKIEQAAAISEKAGQRIDQCAEQVETEVHESLPTYIEMFKELSDFHKSIENERRAAGDPPDIRIFPRRTIEIDRKVPALDIDSIFQ